MRLYLCVQHSHDDDPEATGRNGSVGQIARIMRLYMSLGGHMGDGSLAHFQRIREREGEAALRLYLCTWPFGAGGDPRDIESGMKVYASVSGGSKNLDDRRLGESTQKHIFSRPVRMLVSYHYYKDTDMRELLKCFGSTPVDLIADSGAFSVWSLGATITVDEYAAWLNRWSDLFSAAAALDVIGDPVASYKNTFELSGKITGNGANGKPLEIMPVFHTTDVKFSWLEDYIKAGYSYIGIAPNSLRRTKHQKMIPKWIGECFKRRPEHVRYHGFAVTGWPLLRDFPWYSVDSSSWTSAFRFANLVLFDDSSRQLREIDMTNPKSRLAGADILARYHLRPTQVDSKSYDRDLICAVSVESWQRLEAWLEQRYAQMTQRRPTP